MKLMPSIFGSCAAAVALCAGLAVMAMHQIEARVQQKATQAEAGVKRLMMHGTDPTAVLAILGQVKPALAAGNRKKAEGLLDQALARIAEEEKSRDLQESPALPIFNQVEKPSRLFISPQPVTISGYSGNAMEPFISPDGRFLFFNNENDPNVDTNLHFAKRSGVSAFQYMGELPGANSKSLDAVPSMDAAGHFYFTTLREYDRTMVSIYTGDFDGMRVVNVRPVPGEISPKEPFSVNMDASISPDGQTLYISRAVIIPGAPAPKKSELMVARMHNGSFSIAPDSAHIMMNINTGPLAYAPAISADGLELFFTRASMSASGPAEERARLRIVVATRTSVYEPFGEPRVLTALTGYVEAPSISQDGLELFFHKKIGSRYLIYRAVKKSN